MLTTNEKKVTKQLLKSITLWSVVPFILWNLLVIFEYHVSVEKIGHFYFYLFLLSIPSMSALLLPFAALMGTITGLRRLFSQNDNLSKNDIIKPVALLILLLTVVHSLNNFLILHEVNNRSIYIYREMRNGNYTDYNYKFDKDAFFPSGCQSIPMLIESIAKGEANNQGLWYEDWKQRRIDNRKTELYKKIFSPLFTILLPLIGVQIHFLLSRAKKRDLLKIFLSFFILTILLTLTIQGEELGRNGKIPSLLGTLLPHFFSLIIISSLLKSSINSLNDYKSQIEEDIS